MRNIIISGVNLDPGSRVLLVVHDASDAELMELKSFLEQEFYGVQFTLLSGGIELVGAYNSDTKVIEA